MTANAASGYRSRCSILMSGGFDHSGSPEKSPIFQSKRSFHRIHPRPSRKFAGRSLFRIRSTAKMTFGAATGVSDPRLQKIRGARAKSAERTLIGHRRRTSRTSFDPCHAKPPRPLTSSSCLPFNPISSYVFPFQTLSAWVFIFYLTQPRLVRHFILDCPSLQLAEFKWSYPARIRT